MNEGCGAGHHRCPLRPPEIALEIMMSRNKPNIGKRLPRTTNEKTVALTSRNDSWTGTGPKPRGPLNK